MGAATAAGTSTTGAFTNGAITSGAFADGTFAAGGFTIGEFASGSTRAATAAGTSTAGALAAGTFTAGVFAAGAFAAATFAAGAFAVEGFTVDDGGVGFDEDLVDVLVDGFEKAAASDFEVSDFVNSFEDDAAGDFVDGLESEVVPDDEDFALSLLLDPVTDLTVFSAAEVTFSAGLPSACATPVAKPSRRKPTINPTTTSSRRATHASAHLRGSVASSTGVSDAVLVMAMRSPPWSPATDGCCPARNVMRGRRGRSACARKDPFGRMGARDWRLDVGHAGGEHNMTAVCPWSKMNRMPDTVSVPTITSEAAHRVIAAAEAKATEIGVPMCIAIADTGGNLKAFSRMDGAALLSTQVSQDKAYTAVGFGMPTHGWHDFIKDDAPLADGAVGGIKRLVIFGGGYPITIGDAIVGAIGVSGGHYTQDQEVAEAGLAVLT